MRLELATLLGGRLLDIHSVYNVAFALTEFPSPEFRQAVEEVEAVAHKLIRDCLMRFPWCSRRSSRATAIGPKPNGNASSDLERRGPHFWSAMCVVTSTRTFGEFNHRHEMESGSHATRKWPAAIIRTAKRSLVRGQHVSSSWTGRHKLRRRRPKISSPGRHPYESRHAIQ